MADSPVAPQSRCRQRTLWEAWQKEALRRAFAKNPYPSFRARQDLASQFGVPEARIRVWFQNQRNRSRLVNQGPKGREEDPSMLGSPEAGARAPGRSPTATEGRSRLRTRFSSAQLSLLKQAFERDPKPHYAAREELAQKTGLPEDTIQIWFQNRRARWPSSPSPNLLSHGGGRGRVPGPDSPASPDFHEEAQGLPGREPERAQDTSSSLAHAETRDIHPLTLSCPLTSSRLPLPAAAQHSGPKQDDPEPHSDAGHLDPVCDRLFDQILEELEVGLQAQDTVAPHDQWEQIETSLQAPLDPEEYQALLDLL